VRLAETFPVAARRTMKRSTRIRTSIVWKQLSFVEYEQRAFTTQISGELRVAGLGIIGGMQ